MNLKYIYFFPIAIIVIIFMLYTSRNHYILYQKVKNNNNLTENEKKQICIHGKLHLLFAILLMLWSCNMLLNWYNKKSTVILFT